MSKSLSEIIEALRPGHIGNDNTYVGAQYTIAQLIEDLQSVERRMAQVDQALDTAVKVYEEAFGAMIVGAIQ